MTGKTKRVKSVLSNNTHKQLSRTTYEAPDAITYKPNPVDKKRMKEIADSLGIMSTTEILRASLKKASDSLAVE